MCETTEEPEDRRLVSPASNSQLTHRAYVMARFGMKGEEERLHREGPATVHGETSGGSALNAELAPGAAGRLELALGHHGAKGDDETLGGSALNASSRGSALNAPSGGSALNAELAPGAAGRLELALGHHGTEGDNESVRGSALNTEFASSAEKRSRCRRRRHRPRGRRGGRRPRRRRPAWRTAKPSTPIREEMWGPTRKKQRGAQEDHLAYVARSLQGQDAPRVVRRAAQLAHCAYVARVLGTEGDEGTEALEEERSSTAGLQLRSTQTREPSDPLDLARLLDQMEEDGPLPGPQAFTHTTNEALHHAALGIGNTVISAHRARDEDVHELEKAERQLEELEDEEASEEVRLGQLTPSIACKEDGAGTAVPNTVMKEIGEAVRELEDEQATALDMLGSDDEERASTDVLATSIEEIGEGMEVHGPAAALDDTAEAEDGENGEKAERQLEELEDEEASEKVGLGQLAPSIAFGGSEDVSVEVLDYDGNVFEGYIMPGSTAGSTTPSPTEPGYGDCRQLSSTTVAAPGSNFGSTAGPPQDGEIGEAHEGRCWPDLFKEEEEALIRYLEEEMASGGTCAADYRIRAERWKAHGLGPTLGRCPDETQLVQLLRGLEDFWEEEQYAQSFREIEESDGVVEEEEQTWPTPGGGDTEKWAPAADTRAEEWRARGLERILGPYPGEQEIAHLLREFEEEELARGPAC
jgi:hypothetical protein